MFPDTLKILGMLRISEMKTNSAKTKIVICARDSQIKSDVYIGNRRLDQIDEIPRE